jgi:hypothetical protein
VSNHSLSYIIRTNNLGLHRERFQLTLDDLIIRVQPSYPTWNMIQKLLVEHPFSYINSFVPSHVIGIWQIVLLRGGSPYC